MENKILKSAIATFLTLAATTAISAPAANVEKCYGIVKAGMNDCATATTSCAGSATKDKQADAFILLPAGACKKIAGGTLNA